MFDASISSLRPYLASTGYHLDKVLNGLDPACIRELLKLKTIPLYNLRSSDEKLLLKHPNIRLFATFGDHVPRRHQSCGTIYMCLSAMSLMSPFLNAF